MNADLTRRNFLRHGLGAAALGIGHPALTGAAEAVPSVGGAPGVTSDVLAGWSTYQLGPQIWIRHDNQLVTCYRAHRSQKYPYLFPLAGPATGRSLTEESALPYPHHRSAYFGCDRVNGGNYWQEGFETGQILSKGPRLGPTVAGAVEILDACEWQRPGGPVVMRDQRSIRVTLPGPLLRFVDWDITWTAVEDVKIEKTNHSLFSIRGATDIVPTGRGVLVNAEGERGEKGTYGKRSAWCAFEGRRRGPEGEVQEGIALFDHPGNPWTPCPWFTRDYGFLSPTPFYFRDEPWKIGAGDSVRLRYRLVLFAGGGALAGMSERYREWTG